MNTVKRELSIGLYTICVSAIILILCGLTFLLSTCTREIKGEESELQPGKKIPVNFTMSEVVHGDSEVVTRNQSAVNPETVVIPLGDDLCMVATLEPEPPVTTRAASSNLAQGTLLRVVAYLNGTSYHSHADYTVDRGMLTSGENLHVTANNAYKFVAYSYNSLTTMPVHNFVTDSVMNVDPSYDLLWGCYPKTGTVLVTASTFEDISIVMSHQLSRVTVQVTTVDINGVTINGISDVSITPGNKMNLSVKDSMLVAAADTILKFPPAWSNLNTNTVTSNSRMVYTHNAGAFQVNIGTLSLNEGGTLKSFSNLTATFSKQLKRGVSYTVKIQFKKSGNIIDTNLPYAHFMPYAGAFWKHDQTGERLIRIARPSINLLNGDALSQSEIASADGVWSATVVVGSSWIVLDKVMTSDPNVGWRTDVTPNESNVHNGNDPGFDTQHRVNSSLTSVYGVLGPNPGENHIYFRIGLTGTIAQGAAPRYGMVLLSYKNNTQVRRIWIRQGEEPAVVSANSSDRWSAYNLGNTNSGAGSAYNNGGFVDYPTQAGYFYQWRYSTSTGTPRPYSPEALNPPGGYWVTENSSTTSDMYSLANACPSNYTVPSGGSTPQSQHYALTDPHYVEVSWGYYADGFFDRRLIGDPVGSDAARKSAVSKGNDKIGYVGSVVYSKTTNASIFFPAAGQRTVVPNSGELNFAGRDGMYVSRTEYSNTNVFDLNFWNSGYNPTVTSGFNIPQLNKSIGYSLRCVRN